MPRAGLEGDCMARERGLYRRKDSRYWWISLVLSDGRRVCQSTGCVELTDAESFVVRLKNKALEAKQQGIPGFFLAPEKLSSVASRIERRLSATAEDAPRSQNVAEFATLALRSVN